MGIAKQIARSIVFPTLTGIGLERLYGSFIRQNCMIIMYHGVVPSDTPRYNGRHFSVDTFKKHLSYYKKFFDIVSLEQIFAYYHENYKPKRKTLAITFDDGYLNNLTFAVPLLEKFNFPVTFFIQGMSMEHENAITWPDTINILKAHINGPVEYEDYKFYPTLNEDFYDPAKNISLISFIKKLSYKTRNEFMQLLENQYQVSTIISKTNESVWKLMKPEHIRRIASNNLFEIGSHSYSHYCLGNIDGDSAKQELLQSKMALENVCQKEIVSLAYPDGSYNEEVKKISLEVGYKNLCAVNYQLKSDLGDSSILPRHGLSTTTTIPSNYLYLNKSFKKVGF
ncbi:MAG: polysaccharide deacetylase family protein [Bacteroidales bacterium]